jgi:hypothetical protein
MRTLAVRSDVADLAGQRPIGIRVHHNARFLAELQLGNVILVDVADNPHAAQVGDGKRSCRSRQVDAGRGRIGYVLADDHAGDGRIHVHDAGGVVLVYTQSL